MSDSPNFLNKILDHTHPEELIALGTALGTYAVSEDVCKTAASFVIAYVGSRVLRELMYYRREQ